MFELKTMTKARVLDVRTLARKDRKPDETPGAQLLLSALLPVETLAMLDGFLPGMLYRKAGGETQGQLEGIESVEPTDIGKHLKRLPWVYEQTGCMMVVDYGRGGNANLVLVDCKVHRVSVTPQPNGALWQWTLDAPALSDSTRGKLSGLKSTDITFTLAGPEVDGDDLADQAAKPELTPAQLRKANQQGLTPEQALANSVAKVDNWPFPKTDAAGNPIRSEPADDAAPVEDPAPATKGKRGRAGAAA